MGINTATNANANTYTHVNATAMLHYLRVRNRDVTELVSSFLPPCTPAKRSSRRARIHHTSVAVQHARCCPKTPRAMTV
eukprot:5304911-Lingulodinium_polyedra.AAC.1